MSESPVKFQLKRLYPAYTEILHSDPFPASSSRGTSSSVKTRRQPKLLGSFFQAVHVLFNGPFNIGHLIVLCCVNASGGSQQESQEGRGT